MFALQKVTDPSLKILGVVFKGSNGFNSTSKHLDYTIKSDLIPKFPFASPIDIKGINAFIDVIPFVQVQMCLDETFLNMKAQNSSYKSEVSRITFNSK